MIKLIGIKKSFGELIVLDNLNLNVKKGKITALIGPNGAGKTTLFKIIMGLETIDSGRMLLSNKNITKLSTYEIANKGLSMMPQEMLFFRHLTIREHMILCSKNGIDAVLQQVHLNKPLDSLVYEISYGQKKLLRLAMAILKPHKAMLLDEPVAGVNPILRDQIKNIFLDLKSKGETIFLIEHDIDFVKNIADEIIVLDYGRIIAKGEYEDIKNKKEVRTYLGLS